MSSQIGRLIILHKVPFPYQSEEEDEFVLIEIVETRQVPAVWEPDKTYEGWKALGEDGVHYYCNWSSFPDDSMTPSWSWNDEHENIWYDVAQGIYAPIPFRPDFVDRYHAVIHYCERHKRLDYYNKSEAWKNICLEEGHRPSNPCFDCFTKRPEKEEKAPKTWVGWRK